MAPTKMQSLISCPNCQADNIAGSPHCSSCGSPLGNSVAQDMRASQAAPIAPRAVVSPVALFTSDGQDRNIVRQMYDRASIILTSGENIEYVAVAKGSLGHAPDCVIATNKRLMLYRKKALGKIDLDDCYWRDMSSVTLTDVKGGVNIMFNAIQGWHLLVESLPAAQATKLYDVAITFSERLRDAKQSASENKTTQSGQLSVSETSRPISSPVPATPSGGLIRPLSRGAAPSTPLLSSILSDKAQSDAQAAHHPTGSSLRLTDPSYASSITRNSMSPTHSTQNAPLYIPTPESVLQNILQNSTIDGDHEAGVPTRPMQWSAAAFQAPALAEAQPIVLSEEVIPHSVAADPTYIKVSSEPANPVVDVPPMPEPVKEPWSYRPGESLDGAGKGHDTEPQMRPAPPLTTLERIAVFTMPSGSLGHDISSRHSTSPAPDPVHHVDLAPPAMSRWPGSYDPNTGSFAAHTDSAENASSLESSDTEETALSALAEKISGPLEDTASFVTTMPQPTDWTLESTGVIADTNYDQADAQNTERISVSLVADQVSEALYSLSDEYRTAPDPELTDEPSEPVMTTASIEPETVPAEMPAIAEQAEEPAVIAAPHPEPEPMSASSTLNAQERGDMSDLDEDLISVIGFVGTSASTASGPAPAPLVAASETSVEEKDTYSDQTYEGGSNSHPTAPMGFDFDFLPVPGSMASGPLLAASSNMNAEMEDVYKNVGALATQRLEYDPQSDPGDRPTSINLTLNGSAQAPSAQNSLSNWSASEVPSVQKPFLQVEESKKSRNASGSTSSRSGSSRTPSDDPIAKMKQLKAMLDAGFITDEDYAAKKAEILSRI